MTAEQPLHIDADDADEADRIRLPSGLRRPVLAIEVGNPLRRFGVALYGPHLSGADLDVNECAVLGEFAARAAVAYGQVETNLLRQQIKALEQQLGRIYEN